MKTIRWMTVCAWGVALVLSQQAAGQRDFSPPGWLTRYLENPLASLDEWPNALAPEGEPAAPLFLAENGETDYVIVIPESPTAAEQKSAEELQWWLGKITGAHFPIVLDTAPDQARELNVGRTQREAVADLVAAHGDLGEGYLISVEEERVYLLGGKRAGPFYAVLSLLEEDLGCRWYASDIQRIPNRPTLTAAIVPRRYTPPLHIRDLRRAGGQEAGHKTRPLKPWDARNRLNFGWEAEGFPENYRYLWPDSVHHRAIHNFFTLVPPEEYFEEHPEYYSLIDGERRHKKGQLCLSNPAVAVVAAETILRDIRHTERKPWQILPIQIGGMDVGPGDCQCGRCMALRKRFGSLGGLYLDFANRVSDLLAEALPDTDIALLVYWRAKAPPTLEGFTARPNVLFQYCSDAGADFTWPYHSYNDEEYARDRAYFFRWKELTHNRPFYVFAYPQQWGNLMAPEPNIHAVAENIRFFADNGAVKMHMHGTACDTWEGQWLKSWILAKLMWNPEWDVNDLLLDFVWGVYGNAAPDVVEYHRMLLRRLGEYGVPGNTMWMYPIHTLAFLKNGFVEEARAILDRGLERAENNEIRRRVQELKRGVVFVELAQLYMQMREGNPPPPANRYDAVRDEYARLSKTLGKMSADFHDGDGEGPIIVRPLAEWMEDIKAAKAKRLGED